MGRGGHTPHRGDRAHGRLHRRGRPVPPRCRHPAQLIIARRAVRQPPRDGGVEAGAATRHRAQEDQSVGGQVVVEGQLEIRQRGAGGRTALRHPPIVKRHPHPVECEASPRQQGEPFICAGPEPLRADAPQLHKLHVREARHEVGSLGGPPQQHAAKARRQLLTPGMIGSGWHPVARHHHLPPVEGAVDRAVLEKHTTPGGLERTLHDGESLTRQTHRVDVARGGGHEREDVGVARGRHPGEGGGGHHHHVGLGWRRGGSDGSRGARRGGQ